MKQWTYIAALVLLTLTGEVHGQVVEYKTLKDTVFQEGDLIRLPELDYQVSGGCGVTKETLDSLNSVIDFLATNSDLVVEIGCHSDHRGTEEMNLGMTEFRSRWLVNYLVSKGISEARLTAKGYGESQLIVARSEIDGQRSNEEKETLHRINGRSELRITKR